MNAFSKYFKNHRNLVQQFAKGDLTKREYIKRNTDLVFSLRQDAFERIDTVEKALFNYQYYNVVAKEAKMLSDGYDDYELRKEQQDDVNYYYMLKDEATLAVLKMLDYEGVEAYFINVRSKFLKGKLFEILIDEYGMILHSSNKNILGKLRENGVFTEGIKVSLIDSYINQKY